MKGVCERDIYEGGRHIECVCGEWGGGSSNNRDKNNDIVFLFMKNAS